MWLSHGEIFDFPPQSGKAVTNICRYFHPHSGQEIDKRKPPKAGVRYFTGDNIEDGFAAMPWQNIRYFDHPHSGQGALF